MFERISLELNDEKLEEIDDPYVSSSIMKLITKSQDYVKSDGQMEAFIPDAQLNNNSTAQNTGREMRKILYNNALTRSLKVKYKLADLFNFCSEYRKALYKIPIRVTLTRRFDDEIIKFLFHTADGDANKVGRAWLQDIILKIQQHLC